MVDLEPPFSVEEFFAHQIDPRWEELKEKGNILFKKGDYHESIRLYSQAMYVAHGPVKSIPALFGALRMAPVGSAKRKVSENPALLILVSGYLHIPVTETEYSLSRSESISLRLPNQPAAVCYSNRSAAFMKLAAALDHIGEEARSYLKKALKDAKLACKHCPGYAKGHFRVFQALKCLGNQSAASKKKHQLALYEHYADNMPWAAIAGLTIGWLNLPDFQLVYSTVRLQEVLRRLDASPPDSLLAKASLSPFTGGQFIIVCINSSSSEGKVTYSPLYFVCTEEDEHEMYEEVAYGSLTKAIVQEVKSTLVLIFRAFASHGRFFSYYFFLK